MQEITGPSLESTVGMYQELPAAPSAELTIRLPHFKPVGKKRPRWNRAQGHMHADSKSESYERQLGKAAKVAMIGRKRWESGEALVVFLEAVFPPPKSWSHKRHMLAVMNQIRHTAKPDCDNLLKTIDALNGIVWKDDAQVIDARVMKRYGMEGAVGLTIRVKPA